MRKIRFIKSQCAQMRDPTTNDAEHYRELSPGLNAIQYAYENRAFNERIAAQLRMFAALLPADKRPAFWDEADKWDAMNDEGAV